MRVRLAAIVLPLLSLALVMPVRAAEPEAPKAPAPAKGEMQFPRISGAGGVHAMPAGTDMPARDGTYRVLIDASSDAATEAGSNRHLEAAARAVNLYALAGVPPERVRVAVVVHGKATPLVLSDARYRAHFGKAHPDAGLIARLHEAGVRIFVCGQALTHRGYRPDEVRHEVVLTLSAMTKLVELQDEGYGLIP
jgi:intracellular sulfur oxidation DsrE/DsrF family protein